MAENQTGALAQGQFLLVAANLLQGAFLAGTRAHAKQRFRALQDGSTLGLPSVELEDKSLVQFGLALDATEYRGRLNFSGFRNSLQALLANLSEALREERELKVFEELAGGGSTVFGVTGPTMDQGRVNVLMLAADTTGEQSRTLLKLLYIDPVQFEADS